jgi:hypothetical protein
MQSLVCRIVVAATTLFAVMTAAAPADQTAARYDRAVGQYSALGPAAREAWLDRMLRQRLQPAARVTMNDARYEALLAHDRALIDRVRGGHPFSTDELLATLQEVDKYERAAIEQQATLFRRVTHEAVGTNLWEFQQRVELWHAIERQCAASPDPFAAQPRLIAWLRAAITQQRISSAPPMPKAPDFFALDDRAWQMPAGEGTPQVYTSYQSTALATDAATLAPRIIRYNSELAALVARLYEPELFDVDQLNSLVDDLARIGLVRIALSAEVLDLPDDQRDELAAIEPIDTALALAQVKVSAARRRILRQARHDTRQGQWSELAGLNRIAQRLDTLATGPDR